MSITATPIARRSLVDLAVDQLKAHISAGHWPLGSRIPTEPELVEQLGISRNTVREAVRVLCVTGMLEVRQGDGSYVRSAVDATPALRELNRASLREHLEVRALLEAEAARLAAQRRTEADLQELTRALQQRGDHEQDKTTHGLDAFIEGDLAFHRGIARVARNDALYEIYEFLCQNIRVHLRQSVLDRHLPDPSQAAHQAVLDAITAGNAEGAAAAARAITEPVMAALKQLQDSAT